VAELEKVSANLEEKERELELAKEEAAAFHDLDALAESEGGLAVLTEDVEDAADQIEVRKKS